ncbi:MAG: phenylalanine--tRNA ligase subunit alpha [Clostridiales bacterium]|jgi:phenylalanyl-tRNA synthetase alpha chain|nr:phenylalanine--tRNA ligase subunit alpha [Clostridiales bacterium]
MKDDLLKIKGQALDSIAQAADLRALEDVRVATFGKKGTVTALSRTMGSLSAEERPAMGQMVNEVKDALEAAFTAKKQGLADAALEASLADEKIDITLPGRNFALGSKHPLTTVIDEICRIFMGMGYEIATGPDVETDYHNFEALNIPKNHPARDEQDTFYVEGGHVLRTHTSPVQIRKMSEGRLPIAAVAPGKVFRSDEVDATHSPVFHQIEGLVVDKGIHMGHLKGALTVFAEALFGEGVKTRFRPHHFPFTEPSAEMDISCFGCGQDAEKMQDCRICKGEGWVELLGCGMVHPKVLAGCGIDPEVYSGFAFGMGLERIAMQRYNIDDMRLLFDNDMRFLKQF